MLEELFWDVLHNKNPAEKCSLVSQRGGEERGRENDAYMKYSYHNNDSQLLSCRAASELLARHPGNCSVRSSRAGTRCFRKHRRLVISRGAARLSSQFAVTVVRSTTGLIRA